MARDLFQDYNISPEETPGRDLFAENNIDINKEKQIASLAQNPLLKLAAKTGFTGQGLAEITGRMANNPLVNLFASAGQTAANLPIQLSNRLRKQQLPELNVGVTPGISSDIGSLLGGTTGFGLGAAALAPVLGEAAAGIGAGALIGGAQGGKLGALLGAGTSLAAPLLAKPVGMAVGAIAKTPFIEGATQTIKNTLAPIAKKTISTVLGYLRGGETVESIPKALFSKAVKNYEDIKGNVNKAYEDFRTTAKEKNLPFNDEKFVNGVSGDIEDLKKEISDVPASENEYKPIIDKLEKYKERGVDSFEHAEKVRKSINEAWSDAGDDWRTRNIMNNLRGHIDSALEDSSAADNSVSNKLQAARDMFKNEQLPLEKDLKGNRSNFIKTYKKAPDPEAASENFVSSHIKPNAIDDNVENIKKLHELIPDQRDKNLATYHLFRNTENDPEAFLRQYNKFGEKQKQLLFPNHYEKLDEVNNTVSHIPDLFKEKEMAGVGEMSKSITKALLPAAGFGYLHEPTLAAATLLAKPTINMAGKVAAMNPAIRKLLISKMIEDSGNLSSSSMKQGTSFLKSLLKASVAGNVGKIPAYVESRGNQ